MNKALLIAAIALVFCTDAMMAQGSKSAAERRAFREYTSPQELVSIAPSTTLDKARRCGGR